MTLKLRNQDEIFGELRSLYAKHNQGGILNISALSTMIFLSLPWEGAHDTRRLRWLLSQLGRLEGDLVNVVYQSAQIACEFAYRFSSGHLTLESPTKLFLQMLVGLVWGRECTSSMVRERGEPVHFGLFFPQSDVERYATGSVGLQESHGKRWAYYSSCGLYHWLQGQGYRAPPEFFKHLPMGIQQIQDKDVPVGRYIVGATVLEQADEGDAVARVFRISYSEGRLLKGFPHRGPEGLIFTSQGVERSSAISWIRQGVELRRSDSALELYDYLESVDTKMLMLELYRISQHMERRDV